MFYIHFWTKDGILERVPYPTMKEAEDAAWAWEKAENARLKKSNEITLKGSDRDKMITIITDEANNPCPVNFFGRAFLWDIKHNKHFMNENHWATQFEAVSRGLTPENVVCSKDCYNCEHNVDMDGHQLESAEKLSRDENVMALFAQGNTRKTISERLGVSYSIVCKIVKENQVCV